MFKSCIGYLAIYFIGQSVGDILLVYKTRDEWMQALQILCMSACFSAAVFETCKVWLLLSVNVPCVIVCPVLCAWGFMQYFYTVKFLMFCASG